MHIGPKFSHSYSQESQDAEVRPCLHVRCISNIAPLLVGIDFYLARSPEEIQNKYWSEVLRAVSGANR